jgi:DUF971 family protein
MVQVVSLTAHGRSAELEVGFESGEVYRLPFEYLRVHSPSAEVQGHGPGQGTLQTGKRGVTLLAVEPVGHYAVKLVFSDGHDSGLYTWAWLHELGRNQATRWRQYLEALERSGASRDPS